MKTLATSVAAVALLSSTAAAHIRLDAPLVRYEGAPQKAAPCGMTDGPANRDRSTTFAPGETITVEFTETVYHPGYFRIAFDADGDDGFVDPATGQDTFNSPEVLLDHLLIAPSDERPAGSAESYQIDVTLPDVECDECTLQLIQVMKSDLSAPISPNDLYYRCANIVLAGDGPDAGPAAPDAGTGEPTGTSGGCAAGEAAGALGLLLVGLAALPLLRRRRGERD